MYAYIKGILNSKQNDAIIIEANGIGYKLFTSLTTIESIGAVGNEVKVYTYLYVREDAMNLFGFSTLEEQKMFELLITVSGVGPKAAISMTSALAPSKFGLAVITDDVKSLTKAQGIGTKMAQRIILELKDKIKKEQLIEINTGNDANNNTMINDNLNCNLRDAVNALVVLGYSPCDAHNAIMSIKSDEMDIETMIKSALKQLAR